MMTLEERRIRQRVNQANYQARHASDPTFVAREKATRRAWKSRNPIRCRDHKLKSKYGLPYGVFDLMLENQAGLCGICTRPMKPGKCGTNVDHDPKTGKARMLLCTACNLRLGHMKDPLLNEASASYVEMF